MSDSDKRWSVSEWPIVTVEDLSEKVAMGPFGSSIKVSTFVPKGVPIISGQHLHGTRVDDTPGFSFITSAHAQRLANANVERGDVIFTHAGNIGQVAYIPKRSRFDRYVISQRQFYKKWTPKFGQVCKVEFALMRRTLRRWRSDAIFHRTSRRG